MKINGLDKINMVNKYSGNNAKVTKINDIKKESDMIEISKEGKVLKSYSSEPIEDRTERIAEIKEMIKSGTYNIEPKLTAKSMIDSMRE